MVQDGARVTSDCSELKLHFFHFHIHLSEINLQEVNGGQDGYQPILMCINNGDIPTRNDPQQKDASLRHIRFSISSIPGNKTIVPARSPKCSVTKIGVLESGVHCSLFRCMFNFTAVSTSPPY
jgi:hypothetical protein